MDATIDRVLELAQPSRREVYRRYLERLPAEARAQLLADLELDATIRARRPGGLDLQGRMRLMARAHQALPRPGGRRHA